MPVDCTLKCQTNKQVGENKKRFFWPILEALDKTQQDKGECNSMCGHAKPHPEKYYEERVSEPIKLTRSTSILANTEIMVRCVAQLPGDGYEFFFPVKDRSRTMDGIVVPRALGIMEQKKRTCSFKSPIQPRYGYFRLFNTTDWAIPLPYQGTRPSVNVI